jgi:UrcA family protein
MFKSIKSRFVTAVGIIATTQLAVAGIPADRPEVGRVTVSYSDLDLTNVADARLMLSRLQDAAFHACGGDPRWNANYSVLWSRLRAVYRECRSDAVSRAVLAVDAPLLSRVFLGEDLQSPVRDAAFGGSKYSRLVK